MPIRADYWRRRNAGECVQCREPAGGQAMCNECLAVRRLKYNPFNHVSHRRRALGLCATCKAESPYAYYCRPCALERCRWRNARRAAKKLAGTVSGGSLDAACHNVVA